MNKISILEEGRIKPIVHFTLNGEETLCGDKIARENFHPTTEKVWCPNCIRIVNACKAIPYIYFENQAEQLKRAYGLNK